MGSKLRPLGQTDNATGVWGRGEALLVVVAYSVLCKYTHNYIDIHIYIVIFTDVTYIYIHDIQVSLFKYNFYQTYIRQS